MDLRLDQKAHHREGHWDRESCREQVAVGVLQDHPWLEHSVSGEPLLDS